ncbi:MAG: DEAD/DEAH box helicase [Actinomycetota bacterium]|nr:DEAD/DEAH box helicase [Actinomycetota bacterium]
MEAEARAEARKRTEAAGEASRVARTPEVEQFEHSYGFLFDPFQGRACEALVHGSSVLVAAPTGAGKTVVGEFAAWLALRGGGKTFYTTPIKALSNQKYADFIALHGSSNVGLLTGDNSINSEAPIVVMTTEVLRNMVYDDSPTLDGLHYVVLDEVHYLQDVYRGAVWEEILIHLPVDVLSVSLSATVSNAEEFGEWLQTLRGRTEVIIEEKRPVEIRHWYLAEDDMIPMFVPGPDGRPRPNPKGRDFDRNKRRGRPGPRGSGGPRGKGGPRRGHLRVPRRSDVVQLLSDEAMLPAIYFIFSRKGCDEAVRHCLQANVRLTTSEEAGLIVTYAEERVTELTPDELAILGFDEWIEGLRRGVAAHHAGMIPPFKETVEELFVRGLVKAVFATETLSLGINMPARSVAIENLVKFTGESHELMTPGEYTQLSGRAGRRGIDELGHCIVLLQRFTPFDTISRLASTRTYPLQSSFQPSYNMAVNLVRNYERDEAGHLVNSSFAQFQADREVVALEKTREQQDAYLASYRERMSCDLGDIGEYKSLADKLRKLEEREDARRGRNRAVRTREAIEALRPGDVIELPSGRRRGRYAVVSVGSGRSERAPRILCVSEERGTVRLAVSDFARPPLRVGRVRVPADFDVRDPKSRKELAQRLAAARVSTPKGAPTETKDSKELRAVRRRVETHPCHVCPDISRHLHYADRAARLEREVRRLTKRIDRRTQTLARRFDRVLEVLDDFGYVSDWVLTPRGERLTGVYNESDLLVVEMLELGLLDDLDGPELAAVLSTLVFEERGPGEGAPAYLPTRRTADAWRELEELYRRISRAEKKRGLELTREPDPGFMERAYLWARGAELEEVLDEDDAPGDFVRSVKQLVDLLRQLDEVAPEAQLAATIEQAINGLHRSVVAYSSLGP